MTPNDLLHTSRYAGLAAGDLGRSDGRPPLVLLHGLTFDRTMWRPALIELESLDPDRRALAFDMPGHGDSPDASSYDLETTVARIHDAVEDAEIEEPVLVGHSGSAGAAAMYAARYPSAGIIEVEGTFDVAPFAEMIQSLGTVLRGPGFSAAWTRISAGAFRLTEVPAGVRAFVEATSRPRQEVVLGYWQDLLERTPSELEAMVAAGTAEVRSRGIKVRSVVGQRPSIREEAWLAANLPEAQTLVWPGSGHFPHLAHPRSFAELLASTSTWEGRSLVRVAGR